MAKNEVKVITKVETGDSAEQIDEVSKSAEGLNENLKETEKTTEKTSKAVKKTKDTFSDLPGPIGGVISALKDTGKAMYALVANPIGAVLAAIAATLFTLFKAFTSTNDGADRFDATLAGLKTGLDVVLNSLSKFAEALIGLFENPKQALIDFADLIKENITNRFEGLIELIPALGNAISLLFKGEFKAAGKVATDAVGKVALGVENVTDKVVGAIDEIKKISAEATKAAKESARIETLLQGVEDAERSLRVERSKQQKQMAAARLLMEDDTASFEDRIKALQQVAAGEEALAAKELKIAKQRADALGQRNKLSSASDEALAQEAEAIARVNELEAESVMRRRKVVKSIESLNNQKVAAEKAAAKEIEDSKKQEQERLDKEFEDKNKATENFYKKQQALLLEKNLSDQELKKQQQELELQELNDKLQNAQKYSKDTESIELDLAKKKVDISKNAADAQKKIDDETAANRVKALDSASNTLKTFASLLGETTAEGKALAIAATTIDTYKAAQSAYASLAGIPVVGPALGAAAAAAAIASGLATVNKILSVQVPGGGGSGGSVPSAPPMTRPSSSFTRIDNSTPLDVNNTGATKVYVTETDITNTQKKVDAIKAKAVIG
jgi:tetrahydromethanopterin S-methyltransferase subunit B